MALDVVAQLGTGAERTCSMHSHAEALSELSKLLSGRGLNALFIGGDRWIGKTTLLREFAEISTAAGWQVAAGSVISVRPEIPFGVFIDALSELIERYHEELRAMLPYAHLRWLDRLFTGFAREISPAGPDALADLYGIFHAVRGIIKALSSFGHLVLLLDDMHWADDMSVGLLGYLLRYPPGDAVAVAIGYRPGQAGATLLGALSDAVMSGAGHRVVLRSWPRDDALGLLPEDLSHPRCARLLDESGGNPGLLRGLASLDGPPGPAVDPSPRLQQDMLAACLREYRAVSALGWQVARSAAVLAEPADPDDLRFVAQVTDPQLLTAVDELAGEDLLCLDGPSGRLRFVNPLLRTAALQSAGRGWLLGAHARAVEVLRRRQKPPSQIARHMEHVAVGDEESDARLLLAAAGETMWQDPVLAVRWVRAAAELDAAAAGRDYSRRVLLGKTLALSGFLPEALDVLDALARQVPSGSPAGAEVVCWQARVCYLTGHRAKARQVLDTALGALRPDDAESSAQLSRMRLTVALEGGACPQPEDEACLSRYAASAPGLEAGHAAAVLAAVACRHSSELATHYLAVAARGFDLAADDEAAQHLEGLYWLAHAENRLNCQDRAVRHCERGLRLAEQRRIRAMVPEFAVALGTAQLCAGDLAGAVRHAACARTAAAGMDSDYLLALTMVLEGRIAEAERDPDPEPEREFLTSPGASSDPHEPARVADLIPNRWKTEVGRLSRRETEIAMLVSHGKTNQQIARNLGLSHKTIETYLSRIFKKLSASCRAEVAAIFARAEDPVT